MSGGNFGLLCNGTSLNRSQKLRGSLTASFKAMIVPIREHNGEYNPADLPANCLVPQNSPQFGRWYSRVQQLSRCELPNDYDCFDKHKPEERQEKRERENSTSSRRVAGDRKNNRRGRHSFASNVSFGLLFSLLPFPEHRPSG